MSYRELRELEQLPGQIEALEAERSELNARINAPDFYRQEPDTVRRTLDQLTDLDARLEVSFERWNELESRAGGA
jgi:ATP-binding cassette subfamily F protein uup